ncbi:uncharacterized protein EAF01_010135 [Botrytis porri]|uniref:Uncharacterized protein n=1 Tax=Botrytis porri TaxID=87229 RepID=A0A4Z1L282_9HELO|nr:uncharacterized protein EAF01_010135 [Botrytis porri]KAF7894685.1 hypothetical protein EAF01_010135 [Botrytis porri]TGO90895.1 hypothetical protein BPOR_0047g00180 [Botrytis porri]
MQRTNRPSRENPSDKPSPPMPIDIQIGLQRGSTAALEMTPERLQATKQGPSLSTTERIEELTKENGLLRLEIRYYQRMRNAMQELIDDTKFVTERLNGTVKRFTKVQREAENDWHSAHS